MAHRAIVTGRAGRRHRMLRRREGRYYFRGCLSGVDEVCVVQSRRSRDGFAHDRSRAIVSLGSFKRGTLLLLLMMMLR